MTKYGWLVAVACVLGAMFAGPSDADLQRCYASHSAEVCNHNLIP